MIKKIYFGCFLTSEGTHNSNLFAYSNRKKAKSETIEIARGNCLEGSTCEYIVEDEHEHVIIRGYVSKNKGKYSYHNINE